MRCLQRAINLSRYVFVQPAGALPFSSEHIDQTMGTLGDDENPLQIVDEDEDDSAPTSYQEQADASAIDLSTSPDFNVEDKVLSPNSDLHQTATDTPSHARDQQPKPRPFGSAAEYLRIKREQKQAQRAQAQQLSIRQLSALLGKKMQ